MEIKSVIKNLSTIKRLWPDGFTGESCNFFLSFFLFFFFWEFTKKKVLWKLTPNELKLFQKIAEDGKLLD